MRGKGWLASGGCRLILVRFTGKEIIPEVFSDSGIPLSCKFSLVQLPPSLLLLPPSKLLNDLTVLLQ